MQDGVAKFVSRPEAAESSSFKMQPSFSINLLSAYDSSDSRLQPVRCGGIHVVVPAQMGAAGCGVGHGDYLHT